VAGLSCAVALTLAACGKPSPKPAAPTVVTAGTVARRDVPISVRALGRVQPVRSVAVLSRVAGQIARVAVHDGQTVHAGELLFELDPRQARAALDQARANLARDRAQAAIARDTLRRQAPLAKDGYVSQH
jgi:Multidrug resistance efflux pump